MILVHNKEIRYKLHEKEGAQGLFNSLIINILRDKEQNKV